MNQLKPSFELTHPHIHPAETEDTTPDLIKVYVYPDNDQYDGDDGVPEWKSDDYETRYTDYCTECDQILELEHGKPLAHCECGTRDWSH